MDKDTTHPWLYVVTSDPDSGAREAARATESQLTEERSDQPSAADEHAAEVAQKHRLWLEQFTREHWTRLVVITGGYLRDRSAAEDVVQESLLKMLRWWARNPGREMTVAWAYTVTINSARDHLRRVNRQFEALTELRPGSPEPIADRATYHTAEITLAALPPKVREAFLLCGLAKYSSREAGLLMVLSASTVRGLVAKAVTALREAIMDIDNQVEKPDGNQ